MIKIRHAFILLALLFSSHVYSQTVQECLSSLPKSVLSNETRFFSSSELSQAAHFEACNAEESLITDIFSSTLCKEEASNSSSSFDLEATIKMFDGVFGNKNTDTARSKYCDSKNEFNYSGWKSDSCSEFSEDKFTDDVINKLSRLAAPGAMDVIKGCFTLSKEQIKCAITGAKNENPIITLFLAEHGDINDWNISTVNGKLNKKPNKVLGDGEAEFIFLRANSQSPSGFNAEIQYKDNDGLKSFSCSLSIPKQACKDAIYKQKVSKYCSFKELRKGVGEVCGVKDYVREASEKCKAEQYSLGRAAVCGVGLYKAKADAICGVKRYKQCHSSSCGKKWDGSRKRCRHSSCGVDSYKTCRNQEFGVERYKLCRAPEFGTQTFSVCEHPSHGIASFNSCTHESFGKIFDSCRSPEHGIESCQDKIDTNPKIRVNYEPWFFGVSEKVQQE